MPLSSTHLITWLQTGHIEARVLFPDRIGRMQEFAERFRPMICKRSRNSSLHALIAVEGRVFWYLSLRGSAGACLSNKIIGENDRWSQNFKYLWLGFRSNSICRSCLNAH